MDRRTMLSRALAAGAVVAGAPVLLSACTHAPAAAPARTASGGPGAGDAQAPLFTWSRSLPIDSMSPGIGAIGGTELRALAVMNGSLYAGNSYWRDTRRADPALPGAQVLVLESPAGSWQVDIELSERITSGTRAGLRRYHAIGALSTVTFGSDYRGRPLASPRPVLLASVWDRLGSLTLFSKDGQSGRWSKTILAPAAPPSAQIRSFGYHRDTVTRTDLVFAGTNPVGILSGAYDPAGPGQIAWDTRPEPGVSPTRAYQRVMSFAECNGRLYATVGWEIYQRQDGSTPSWTKVFTWGQDLPLNGNGGLRGLTSIADPAGGGQVLLVAAEGPQARLLRIAPRDQFSVTIDLNVASYASAELRTAVRSLIAAYNNMTLYPPYSSAPQPGVSPGSLLIGGYHAATPQSPSGLGRARIAPGAYVLIRGPHGGYRSLQVLDPAITPTPALVATRTITVSPFPSDPPGTIYAGGFDAGELTPHNSAWLYRGTPNAT
jgi:hypothetical protein